MNNQLLHQNPSDTLVCDDGPSDEWVDAASVFAYTSYLLLTQLMITRHRPELEQAFDQELKPIASAMGSAGREDLSVCAWIRRTATHCARAEAS